jgi:hypothetical protein
MASNEAIMALARDVRHLQEKAVIGPPHRAPHAARGTRALLARVRMAAPITGCDRSPTMSGSNRATKVCKANGESDVGWPAVTAIAWPRPTKAPDRTGDRDAVIHLTRFFL